MVMMHFGVRSAAGVAAAEEGALISFIADVAAGRKGRPQGTTAAHKALEVETARLRQDHMKHRKDMLESLGERGARALSRIARKHACTIVPSPWFR